MKTRPYKIIGELMNNSFARARKAWETRDLDAYQKLARIQTDLGADFMTLNVDGTQRVQVKMEEMLEFLPSLIKAIQEVTPVPLSFDNPAVVYHQVALQHYDRSISGAPILNSVAASRHDLDEMIALAKEYDTLVIVMASEKFVDGGGAQCVTAQEVYETAKRFTGMLVERAGRSTDQIIIDPGLAPVSADTYGLVNLSLDGMQLISEDPDMKGVHLSVGLTNFSFGTPPKIRTPLENAYITLAMERGLDFVLGNPEKDLKVLDAADPALATVKKALAAGRPVNGESQEDAGFRQAECIMELF